MPNYYDKVFRESFGKAFLNMVERWFSIEIGEVSDLPGKLERTLEREPDFLKLVKNSDGSSFILHLEIQTSNDSGMIERMRTYHALLMEKYRVPIRQLVVYVGRSPAKMRTELEEWEIMTGFEMQDIARMDYREFLDSEVMEEIVFTILADPKDKEGAEVVKLILSKLYEIGGDEKETHRAIQQLLILSRISKLDSKVELELKNMPFTIDITKDRLYNRGKREGIVEAKLEFALKILNSGKFSWEEIEKMSGHSKEEILEFKKQSEK